MRILISLAFICLIILSPIVDAATPAKVFTYKRLNDGYWGPATLVIKISKDETKPDFELSTPTAQGELRGVSGVAHVQTRQTMVYVNKECDPIEDGIITFKALSDTKIQVVGGAIYCDPFTSLEGTYTLVSKK